MRRAYSREVDAAVAVATSDVHTGFSAGRGADGFGEFLRHREHVVGWPGKKSGSAKGLDPCSLAVIHQHQIGALHGHVSVGENCGGGHRVWDSETVKDGADLQVAEVGMVFHQRVEADTPTNRLACPLDEQNSGARIGDRIEALESGAIARDGERAVLAAAQPDGVGPVAPCGHLADRPTGSSRLALLDAQSECGESGVAGGLCSSAPEWRGAQQLQLAQELSDAMYAEEKRYRAHGP